MSPSAVTFASKCISWPRCACLLLSCPTSVKVTIGLVGKSSSLLHDVKLIDKTTLRASIRLIYKYFFMVNL